LSGPPLQAWQLVDLPLHKLLSEGRRVAREDCPREVRVAVLGDAATQHYAMALAAVLKLRGCWPELYEAEFDVVRQEVLDPGSGLHRHQPRFVVLLSCVQALEERVIEEPGLAPAQVAADMAGLWDRLTEGGATVLQHALVLPLERSLGSQTLDHAASPAGFAHELNHRLREAARSRPAVRLLDTEGQAAYHGKASWLDERLWCQARQALSPRFLPALAKVVSDTLLAELGVGVKCVVTDLDNTLWGGLLGEDGLEGIEVGRTEVGLAHRRLQSLLLSLKRRGVLLAALTRNDPALARRAFTDHPDMLLRLGDFAAFEATWGDKREGMARIREALNIGFDTMVFLDDTPFERDAMRRAFPELQVPELPADPGEVLSALARFHLFETAALTAEDAARTRYYQEDAGRQALRASFEDLGAYLDSLAMEAEVRPFDDFTSPRVLQLVQRSNQFNLTTQRYGAADLQRMGAAPEVGTFSIRLSDRLGDNGIVAVVVTRQEGTALLVDTWIMSCRVLGRRLEELTLELIVREAARRGCRRVVGLYRPTAKNGMVADLYPRLGFTPEPAAGPDERRFALEVEGWRAPALPIRLRAGLEEDAARGE
jgi:FkbH-like protein